MGLSVLSFVCFVDVRKMCELPYLCFLFVPFQFSLRYVHLRLMLPSASMSFFACLLSFCPSTTNGECGLASRTNFPPLSSPPSSLPKGQHISNVTPPESLDGPISLSDVRADGTPSFVRNQSEWKCGIFCPRGKLTPGCVNYASLGCCQCVHNGGPSFGLFATTVFTFLSV